MKVLFAMGHWKPEDNTACICKIRFKVSFCRFVTDSLLKGQYISVHDVLRCMEKLFDVLLYVGHEFG